MSRRYWNPVGAKNLARPIPGTQCSHITHEDFDEDVWDVICAARLMYKRNIDKSTWYRVLREYCGYRGGVWMKKRMEHIADEWLAQHPTWAARYEARAGNLTKEYRNG